MIIFNQPCLSFGSSFVGPPNVSHGKLWGFINLEIPNPIKISQGIYTYGLQKKIKKKYLLVELIYSLLSRTKVDHINVPINVALYI